MNKGQLKTRIFLIRAVDMSLLIIVFTIGIYSVLYAENKELMATATLVGLFLVNRLGNFSTAKIATLRVDLEKQQRLDDKLKK